jgi:hypothetical protein
VNEEALAHWELLHQKKKKKTKIIFALDFFIDAV